MPGEQKPLSELTAATALTGAEIVPLVQGGATRRSTVAAMAAAMAAGSGPAYFGGKVVGATSTGLASGENDLYTVPAGKIAVVSTVQVFNPTGGSISVTAKLKSGGVYYRIGGTSAVSANALGAPGVLSLAVLAAGESVSIHTTGAGLAGTVRLLELPAGSFTPTRLLSVSTGDNTLYTCPTGKAAYLLTNTVLALGANSGAVAHVNESGATRTAIVKLGSTQLAASTMTGNNGVNNVSPIFASLTAGQSLVVNLDAGTATQALYAAFLEIDAP